MPPNASALYCRWWQLETWLRSLVYVELRAESGNAWADVLPKIPPGRQQKEDEFEYMPTSDAQDRMAYLDVGPLFQLTLDHWHLFKSSLLARTVWTGRIDELKTIRNRIGHCRRPHEDDLDRVEQTLRDLERGAFRALSAFNDRSRAEPAGSDAVTDGWGNRRLHPTAARLVDHAARQYDTSFRLLCSRRPWASPASPGQPISGVPGYIWHAVWYFRGGRPFDLRRFWSDLGSVQPEVLLVCADTASSLEVSFSAVDDPVAIADAIGTCFDAALGSLGHGTGTSEGHLEWCQRYADVDPRVHAGTLWASVDSSMTGVTLFDA